MVGQGGLSGAAAAETLLVHIIGMARRELKATGRSEGLSYLLGCIMVYESRNIVIAGSHRRIGTIGLGPAHHLRES